MAKQALTRIMLLRQKVTISCDITGRSVSNALKDPKTRIILTRTKKIIMLQISSRTQVKSSFIFCFGFNFNEQSNA